MAVFSYTVRNRRGEIERGTLTDMTQEQVISHLQEKGYAVISVTEARTQKGEAGAGIARALKPAQRRFHRAVKLDDLIVFARQLAVLLDAGVTLLKSLTLLSQQIESLALFNAAEQVRKDVEEGSSFKNALAKHPKIFSAYWVSLVETGEATGQLSTVIEELANHLEKAGALRRKVVSALMYPILLVCASGGAIIFFMVFIIPVFSGIFATAEVDLPLMTRIVVGLSTLIRKYFILLIFAGGLAAYGGYLYVRTEAGRWNVDFFSMQIPVVGDLLRRLATARFASSLATLIKSGTPIVSSMDILVNTTENRVVKKALQGVRESVKEGKGMAGPLAASGVFPLLVGQMVQVGEETGELSNMLERLSRFYEERVSATVERMTALFEPVMLIFMGAIVGFLVISMFMPIFKLGQTVR